MLMALLAGLAAAAPEVPSSIVQVAQEGQVYVMRNLIDNNPLYTFDKDEPGKSNCIDACAATWHPLTANGDEKPLGRWTLVSRDDGSSQWAFDGMPVYSFARDPEPAAARDGTTGKWHLLPTPPAN